MNPKIPPKLVSYKFSLFGLLAVSFFLIVLAFTITSFRTSFLTKAGGSSVSTIPGLVSSENSYVFASPIEAKAGGTSIIRVTVFLLDNQGLGVSGQKVQLRPSTPLTISQVQPTTDSLGRAIFDVIANTAGDYTITAEAAGASLPQTVTVSFR